MSNEIKDFLKFVISFWFFLVFIINPLILVLCMLFTVIRHWL